jgi:uncharacterized membrane protein YphA (DoxX/SURF4 family)
LHDSRRLPGRSGLQRLFSTFPGRTPGAGLLLLRAALGATLVSQGISCVSDWQTSTLINLAVCLLLFISSVLLLVGYMTPLASMVAGVSSLGSALSLFPEPARGFLASRPAAALAATIAAALLCLGPGAFSVDARLFGRREIVISNSSPPPDI